MKTRRTVWANGFLFVALVATTAVGCGSDDDDEGGAGTGGTAGKGGSAGAGKGGGAGTGGTAGKGGTGGTAGKGGTGGTAGNNAGNGGSSGTSGAAGTGEAGDAGAAGITGSGGSGGESAGAGGESGSGDGGTDAGGAGGDAAGSGGTDTGESGAGGDSAGAGGEPGVEPTPCEAYCDVMMATCEAGSANAQYPTEAQCLATCAVFPEGTTGNSLGCRVTHAALAASAGVDPHCDHAGPAGIGMCGSNCEGYCSLMMNICAGTFATVEACLTECGGVPESTFTNFVYPAPAGDTLQCRIAHATNAAASTGAARTNHCGHAAGAAPCAN